MNPERWQQVKQALDSVLGMHSAQRLPYLAKLSTSDPELHREVETLLRSHEQVETSFLRDPALAVLPEFDTPHQARTGRRIGAYNVLEEIGRGGMGEVYRAVRADGEFDREVAVKLVRSGFDSQFILERFRHERQILAGLDHPNIARLLDGATTDDGIPYLVMELVEGTAIDAHCTIRALSIPQRLDLFLPVCAAVHYAHQHLVIHRDLKPGNILVTPDGVPKLLDFGIAKIVSPTGGLETTMMHPLTPQYASPEQLRGQAVSTASDVYSLGVVLYQLLTGHMPFSAYTASAPDLARAICELEPARPSSVSANPAGNGKSSSGRTADRSPQKWQRHLRGDLDNIVLKAMRKEPARRYASAEQLAADLRCHLQGLPVSARQDSWTYRTEKFIRRHTAIVAATLIVILTLAVGMALTLREKRIAERRFNDVRKLANSLIFEIDNAIADIPGSTAARKLLVGRALEYLDNLSQQARGDKSLQTELATAYEKVGDVLGYPYAPNLGDSAGALASYRKALRIRESLATSAPNEVKLQRQLAGNYFRIANALEFTGDLPGALEALRKTLPITEKLAASKTDPELTDLFAGSHYFIAVLLSKTGDPAGALENYRQAAAIRQPVLQIYPSNVNLRSHLAGDYSGMAASMHWLGDPVQAIAMQTRSIEILRELSSSEPNSVSVREYLGEAINKLSGFQRDQGKFADSLTTAREAQQIFRSLLAADSNNSLAKANVAFAGIGIAEALVQSGQPALALPILQESLDTFRAMSPDTATNRYVRTGYAEANSTMGSACVSLATHRSRAQATEKWREARSWYEKSLAVWTEKEKRNELESDERDERQQVLTQIARCDAELKQFASHPQH